MSHDLEEGEEGELLPSSSPPPAFNIQRNTGNAAQNNGGSGGYRSGPPPSAPAPYQQRPSPAPPQQAGMYGRPGPAQSYNQPPPDRRQGPPPHQQQQQSAKQQPPLLYGQNAAAAQQQRPGGGGVGGSGAALGRGGQGQGGAPYGQQNQQVPPPGAAGVDRQRYPPPPPPQQQHGRGWNQGVQPQQQRWQGQQQQQQQPPGQAGPGRPGQTQQQRGPQPPLQGQRPGQPSMLGAPQRPQQPGKSPTSSGAGAGTAAGPLSPRGGAMPGQHQQQQQQRPQQQHGGSGPGAAAARPPGQQQPPSSVAGAAASQGHGHFDRGVQPAPPLHQHGQQQQRPALQGSGRPPLPPQSALAPSSNAGPGGILGKTGPHGQVSGGGIGSGGLLRPPQQSPSHGGGNSMMMGKGTTAAGPPQPPPGRAGPGQQQPPQQQQRMGMHQQQQQQNQRPGGAGLLPQPPQQPPSAAGPGGRPAPLLPAPGIGSGSGGGAAAASSSASAPSSSSLVGAASASSPVANAHVNSNSNAGAPQGLLGRRPMMGMTGHMQQHQQQQHQQQVQGGNQQVRPGMAGGGGGSSLLGQPQMMRGRPGQPQAGPQQQNQQQHQRGSLLGAAGSLQQQHPLGGGIGGGGIGGQQQQQVRPGMAMMGGGAGAAGGRATASVSGSDWDGTRGRALGGVGIGGGGAWDQKQAMLQSLSQQQQLARGIGVGSMGYDRQRAPMNNQPQQQQQQVPGLHPGMDHRRGMAAGPGSALRDPYDRNGPGRDGGYGQQFDDRQQQRRMGGSMDSPGRGYDAGPRDDFDRRYGHQQQQQQRFDRDLGLSSRSLSAGRDDFGREMPGHRAGDAVAGRYGGHGDYDRRGDVGMFSSGGFMRGDSRDRDRGVMMTSADEDDDDDDYRAFSGRGGSGQQHQQQRNLFMSRQRSDASDAAAASMTAAGDEDEVGAGGMMLGREAALDDEEDEDQEEAGVVDRTKGGKVSIGKGGAAAKDKKEKLVLPSALTRAADGTVIPIRYEAIVKDVLVNDAVAAPLLTEAVMSSSLSAAVPSTPSAASSSASFHAPLPLTVTRERVMEAMKHLDSMVKSVSESIVALEKELPEHRSKVEANRASFSAQQERVAAREAAKRAEEEKRRAAEDAAEAAADDAAAPSSTAGGMDLVDAVDASASSSVSGAAQMIAITPMTEPVDITDLSPMAPLSLLSDRIGVSQSAAAVALHVLSLAGSWQPSPAWHAQVTYTPRATLLAADGSAVTAVAGGSTAAAAASAASKCGFGGLDVAGAAATGEDDEAGGKAGDAKKKSKEKESAADRNAAIQRYLKRTTVERLVSAVGGGLTRICGSQSFECGLGSDEDATIVLVDDTDGSAVPLSEKELFASAPSALSGASSSASATAAASRACAFSSTASASVGAVVRLHGSLPYSILTTSASAAATASDDATSPSNASLASAAVPTAPFHLAAAVAAGDVAIRLPSDMPRVSVFALTPPGAAPGTIVYATVAASLEDLDRLTRALAPRQHPSLRNRRKGAAVALPQPGLCAPDASSAPSSHLLVAAMSPLLDHTAAWAASDAARSTWLLENRGRAVLAHADVLRLEPSNAGSALMLASASRMDVEGPSVVMTAPAKVTHKQSHQRLLADAVATAASGDVAMQIEDAESAITTSSSSSSVMPRTLRVALLSKLRAGSSTPQAHASTAAAAEGGASAVIAADVTVSPASSVTSAYTDLAHGLQALQHTSSVQQQSREQPAAVDLTVLAALSPLLLAALHRGPVAPEAIAQRLALNQQSHVAMRPYLHQHMLHHRAPIRARSIALASAYVSARKVWRARCREVMLHRRGRAIDPLRRKRAEEDAAQMQAMALLAASPRVGTERTGRRAAAVAAAAAISATGTANAGTALLGSMSSAQAAERAKAAALAGLAADEAEAIDPITDLPSDSEDEGLSGLTDDMVRSEWELQQKLEQIAQKERRETARLYMTVQIPDMIPDRRERKARMMSYNANSRLTTDGAPALCSHVPPRFSCVAMRPGPHQLSPISSGGSAVIGDLGGAARKMLLPGSRDGISQGTAVIPQLLAHRHNASQLASSSSSMPVLLDQPADFSMDDGTVSAAASSTDNIVRAAVATSAPAALSSASPLSIVLQAKSATVANGTANGEADADVSSSSTQPIIGAVLLPLGSGASSIGGSSVEAAAAHSRCYLKHRHEHAVHEGLTDHADCAVCCPSGADHHHDRHHQYGAFTPHSGGNIPIDRRTSWFGGCNCPLAVEIAYKQMNPWSDAEKLIYTDKFMAHPKDFTTIAAYLPNKTAADCIAFYYLTKHTGGYKMRLKAQVNAARRRATHNGWLQACGAARDLGVPIHADTARGGSLKDRAKKVVNAAQRVGDLSYSRLFIHPGPYARLHLLHRFVTMPVPLTTILAATSPLLASGLLTNGASNAGASAGASSNAGIQNVASFPFASLAIGTPSRGGGAAASTPSGTAAAALMQASKDAQSQSLQQQLQQLPKDVRNEFIFAYGVGYTSLPWGVKFQQSVSEVDAADPMTYMTLNVIPQAAAAGAGAGIGASLVRVYMAADTLAKSEARRFDHGSSRAGGAFAERNGQSVRSQVLRAAADMSRAGLACTGSNNSDVNKLVPPSVLPLSGTVNGVVGHGPAGSTHASYPIPPSVVAHTADFVVHTLVPALVESIASWSSDSTASSGAGGGGSADTSSVRAWVSSVLQPLSSLDDDRATGLAWCIASAAAATHGGVDEGSGGPFIRMLMDRLASDSGETEQHGETRKRRLAAATLSHHGHHKAAPDVDAESSSLPISGAASLLPLMSRLGLGLSASSRPPAGAGSSVDHGHTAADDDAMTRVDGINSKRLKKDGDNEGPVLAVPSVVTAQPLPSTGGGGGVNSKPSQLSISPTAQSSSSPSLHANLTQALLTALSRLPPVLRSIITYLLQTSSQAPAASPSQASSTTAAAAAAALSASASPLPVPSGRGRKKSVAAASASTNNADENGFGTGAGVNGAVDASERVSLLSTGEYYHPAGPTVTLRYFDPLSSPYAYVGHGDVAGVWPYQDLVLAERAADKVDVMAARRVRKIYARAGVVTKPPPWLRTSTAGTGAGAPARVSSGHHQLPTASGNCGAADDSYDADSDGDASIVAGGDAAVAAARRRRSANRAQAASSSAVVPLPATAAAVAGASAVAASSGSGSGAALTSAARLSAVPAASPSAGQASALGNQVYTSDIDAGEDNDDGAAGGSASNPAYKRGRLESSSSMLSAADDRQMAQQQQHAAGDSQDDAAGEVDVEQMIGDVADAAAPTAVAADTADDDDEGADAEANEHPDIDDSGEDDEDADGRGDNADDQHLPYAEDDEAAGQMDDDGSGYYGEEQQQLGQYGGGEYDDQAPPQYYDEGDGDQQQQDNDDGGGDGGYAGGNADIPYQPTGMCYDDTSGDGYADGDMYDQGQYQSDQQQQAVDGDGGDASYDPYGDSNANMIGADDGAPLSSSADVPESLLAAAAGSHDVGVSSATSSGTSLNQSGMPGMAVGIGIAPYQPGHTANINVTMDSQLEGTAAGDGGDGRNAASGSASVTGSSRENMDVE